MRVFNRVLCPTVWAVLGVLCLLPLPSTHAQTPTPPDLTEMYNGRGRLAGVTFSHPEGWTTVNGIPVNRLVSFNLVSSVPIGLRNRIDPGEEAIVLAVAGGRIDRWDDLEAGATPEDVLTVFIEALGDDNGFSDPANADAEFEIEVEELTFNGYDAVRMRYIAVPAPDATEDPNAEPQVEGDFTAYAVLLDGNQFVVVLTLTSELTFEEAQPTIEGILDSMVYTSGR